MTAQQNWRQLTSIQVGGAICLPVIMIGQTLSQNYGFASAMIAILIGNILLLVLGVVSANMSHAKQKTTVENAVEYFGQRGVSLFACAMIVTMVCWFGIQLNLMSISLIDLLPFATPAPELTIAVNIVIGSLISVVALYGIRSLNILSNLSMPVLVGTLGYALFLKDGDAARITDPMSLGGISLVIAAAIGVIIDLPTYFRHARTKKDGIVSIILIFGVALPVIEFVGVYLATFSSEGTVLEVLKTKDGYLWNMWVALFLVLAGWTTNNTNLYSGVMSLEYLLPKTSHTQRTLLFGAMATALSCLDLLNHLELMLDLLGVMLCSIGAVILTRYLITQILGREPSDKEYKRHFSAWAFGTLLGIGSIMGWVSLTTIAVIDAYIGAMIGTSLILINKKEQYEQAYIE